MQVTVVGRHGDVDEGLKQYVTDRLEKLPRYYDRVMMIEVIFDGQASQKPVEIVVSAARHREFVAREAGNDSYASFDLCFDKIERQLRRHKERVRNRKHPVKPAPQELE